MYNLVSWKNPLPDHDVNVLDHDCYLVQFAIVLQACDLKD